MSLLTLSRVVALCVLSLTATTSAMARSAESMPVPGAEQLGGPSGFIGDDGQAVVLAKMTDDAARVVLLIWKGSSVREVELPGARDGFSQGVTPLPDGRFVFRSVPDDGSSHGGTISTQVYSLTGTRKAKLRWTGSEENYALSPIRISGDGKAWGVMAPSPASKEARERLGVQSRFVDVTSGVHLAFGSFRSRKISRKHTVLFYDWVDHRDIGLSGQSTRFAFLDSEGPVLVLPYADDVYLLRFADSGVISEQVEPMKPLMQATGGGLHFTWQDEDRVLWSGGTGEWLAWDLWDLGLSGFPEEPFLRLPYRSGRPHRTRGFVRTVRDGGRYRVEHLWQSPHSSNRRERRVSDWQQGTPTGFPDVSPDGRHVLVFEQRVFDEDTEGLQGLVDEQRPERQSREKTYRYHARRFELFPAPVESAETLPPSTAPRHQGVRNPDGPAEHPEAGTS